MLDSTVADRAQAVLSTLGAALDAGEIDRATDLFTTDCHWRDLVSFTWNIRTMEGPDQVADMLRAQLGHIRPAGWQLDPAEIPGEEDGVITAWFRFETQVGRGYGLVRLRDGRIWTLLTALQEL
ncbi:MAG: nuclear transport factor 2 family protein, partial [Paracoccus sp. (in: a-proteobacteria)]|uniref:nuclear transport factor 2 family protein n=1 Tax=Paracoccus sp. TaxID=267 RepID=UPI00391AF6FA